MATSQRLSRGFHRLALFLAAIPLIVGVFAIANVLAQADRATRQHQQLLCAHDYLVQERLLLSDDEMKDVKPWQIPWKLYEPIAVGMVVGEYTKDWKIILNQIGCSDLEYDTVTYGEARNPPDFNWFHELGLPLALAVAITLAVSLSVYGIIRAIGWVIGGFAAS